MAITITNRGLYLIAKDDMSLLDLRIAVFTGVVPAAATIQDWDTLADPVASALVEAGVAGYIRTDVSGVTLTEDDTGNEVTLAADAMTLTSVAAGETWTCVAWYKENTGDTGDLIAIDEPAATLITNGGNVTLPAFDFTINRV